MKNKNYELYYDMQSTFDDLYEKALNNKNFKHLYEIIVSRNNILLAYRNIKANTGSKTAGCDGKTIKDYKTMTEDEILQEIKESLNNYQPNNIKRVYIPKKNGKQRPLGIPTIRDRIIQQAILQVLEPICEAKFHPHSYGFRPNRGTQHAIARMSTLINISQLTYVVDIDIKGFFDNVNHKKLRQQIWGLGIHDKRLLAIIAKMLKAPIKGIGIPTKGTPQGSILSPLLANIVLNSLDWWISNQWETFESRRTYSRNDAKYLNLRKTTRLKTGYLIRYADDFKIMCKDYNTARKWFIATTIWLKKNLDLEISPEKSRITNTNNTPSEFLGFALKAVLRGGHKGRDKGKMKYFCISQVSRKNIEIIIDKTREYVKQIQKRGTKKSVWDYNVYIIGIHNYFRIATNCHGNFVEINFRTMQVKHNRFKNLAQVKKKSCVSCHFPRAIYNESSAMTYVIGKQSMVPIHYVKFQKPLLFSQNICDYTVQGRTANQTGSMNAIMAKCVKYLAQHFIENRSVEYNDNRISAFSASRGKCYITGKDLTQCIDEYHCHHKKPLYLGGSDEYKNLCPLCIEVHLLVHAKLEETIQKHIHVIKNKQALTRLNMLRKMCELNEIKL